MRYLKALRQIDKIKEILVCQRTCEDWLVLALAYGGIKKLSYPYLFETKSGQKILLNTFHDLVTVWVIFIRGEYFVDPNCAFIIDAGANIGSFSIFAAARAPHATILSFEPFPKTFALLKANIQLNGLENRVKIMPTGLGAQDGTALMDSDPNLPSQSNGTTDSLEGGIPVSIQSLKSVFRSQNITHVDLLKMDIEGGEHAIISDATAEDFCRVRHFSLEYHPNGSFKKICDKLEALNFNLVKNFKFHEDSGVAWFVRKQ